MRTASKIEASVGDVISLGDDPQLYRVEAVEPESGIAYMLVAIETRGGAV